MLVEAFGFALGCSCLRRVAGVLAVLVVRLVLVRSVPAVEARGSRHIDSVVLLAPSLVLLSSTLLVPVTSFLGRRVFKRCAAGTDIIVEGKLADHLVSFGSDAGNSSVLCLLTLLHWWLSLSVRCALLSFHLLIAVSLEPCAVVVVVVVVEVFAATPLAIKLDHNRSGRYNFGRCS